MQRKPTNFPVANCNIKMPDCLPANMEPVYEEESEQRRLQLINFGHSQWGFNNWSWSVTKQELDFVEFANGVYTAGVATFVAVTLRALDVRREAVGYAGAAAASKAAAISRARKSSVVDALRETLLGLGGAPAAALAELLAAGVPAAHPAPAVAPVLPTPAAPPAAAPVPLAAALPPERPRALPDIAPVPAKPGPPPPPPTRPLPIAGPPPPTRPLPVAAALPMPAAAPAGSARAARPTPGPAPRPANVSFVLPMMGGMYGGRLPAPGALCPGYYELPGWGCAREEPAPPCWVKPTLFYDGFWTEHKLRRWLAEQLGPDETRASPART